MSKYPFRHDREEIEQLLQQFENLRFGRPNSYLEEEGFERLIDHFHDLENYNKAMQVIDYGLAQYPYSTAMLLSKANLHIIFKEYQKALEVLDAVESLDSSDVDLYILRTDAFLALDMQQKAAEILEEALHRFEGEDRIELLFELADVYDDYEDFEKVYDCLVMILNQDPENDEALYKICFWTDFTGRFEESIKLHQKLIENHPYNELAWFNLGTAYQGLKLHEKAIDAYQYAVAINEKFDVAYRNLADAYMRIRNYKEAIEALQKVITLAMPESMIFEAIAYCYSKLRDHAQARFYYRKALHLNQDDAHLFYKVAQSYMEDALWTQAIKNLEKAIAIKPKKQEYQLAIGKSFGEMGNLALSRQYLENALRLKPKNTNTWIAILKTIYKEEKHSTGLEYSKIAYENTGHKPVFMFFKTLFLMALGKTQEALYVLDEALSMQVNQVNIIIGINPSLLQMPQVTELINRYKTTSKKKK